MFYLSQDDTAKVPLGLPIWKKQTAVIMPVGYKVSLPDHDLPICTQHKLIPSVYAGCVMKEGEISCSSPICIAIRSQKQSSFTATAESHQRDFDRLVELEELNSLAEAPYLCRCGQWTRPATRQILRFSILTVQR